MGKGGISAGYGPTLLVTCRWRLSAPKSCGAMHLKLAAGHGTGELSGGEVQGRAREARGRAGQVRAEQGKRGVERVKPGVQRGRHGGILGEEWGQGGAYLLVLSRTAVSGRRDLMQTAGGRCGGVGGTLVSAGTAVRRGAAVRGTQMAAFPASPYMRPPS